MTPPPGPTGTRAERLTDLEYAAAWRLLRVLPTAPTLAAFRRGADVATRRNGPGVRQLRANLARVVPTAGPAELDALVRAGMRSYARYWFEAFRLPAMDPVDLHARTVIDGPGEAPLYAALDAGRGVVMALPHIGNWDAAGVWLVQMLRSRGLPASFTTVAQRLKPESLYRRFVGYRESLGFEVVSAEDGSLAHRAMTRRLRAGGVVCLVADRDLTATGVPVSLFGAPARLPAGPARLAALTGAMVLPTFPRFTPQGWGVGFDEPVPVAGRTGVAAATQGFADAMGRMIPRSAADWHVLQPIWRDADVRSPVPG
ncbi:phosphatidylinositol mannoside acyltransferase [Pseudonocardia sp. GCM10023141]|uniref:phosphatidylinositol mannoside acyltransferase n=1 Tax=Pseudonocardia sp. GCM10023141 TaxID=3252653 RepID=UPI00360A5D93